MNKQTRRVSRMPEEVRDELSTFFCEKQVLKENFKERIEKLNDKAKYVTSDLKRYIQTRSNYLQPMWSDLDVNYHVNNVKYVKWILEYPTTFSTYVILSDVVCVSGV
ncbi:hypothetical protein RHGRI_034041 [Rhododendron griersonianum]|uniref:Acyl-ACP thioesterase-like C-terminal domain-containing protein n=1 Tax=Rhododendron griersonianum TaxID=479676 RepID=A0AAV6HZ30_9ERIC|nr:hypothetical protein RHGRI_034041 [Rhododendron griersonianum]